MTTNVLIIGAGFAGRAAMQSLAALTLRRQDLTVRLFDGNPHTTMIPALPDVAGGRYDGAPLTAKIERHLRGRTVFHQERVTTLDFNARTVTTARARYPYDYLVVATGSVTNFYGFDQHLDAVHKLDGLQDALDLRARYDAYLRRSEHPTAVIAGGGYTGLELACNLQFAGRNFRPPPRVCIVELQDRILPSMSAAVRDYLRQQAEARKIELITGAAVERFDGANVTLSNGRRIEDAFLCWTTGTKFAIDDMRGRHEQLKDGRLDVAPTLCLRQHPDVFAAGDAAALRDGETVLRKAVNFSIDSGRHAGRNVVRALQGHPLEPFHPVDLGWVIPFCNVGIGLLFGRLPVRGRFPLALHYAMCGVRNYNLSNALFFLKTAARSLV